jgi:hypothetical protein
MFRSSILSFESFEGFRPRWPATLLGVAAVLALLETAVRFLPEERLIPAKSRQGEIFWIEREVLPKFAAPRILLLGSSRIRRAVTPKQLDGELGLPAGSTLNLGLASGRIFEALYLYERNQAKLSSAKLVVLALDEWHLSAGWRLGSLYETHAPFAERVRFSAELRSRLILDGLFTLRLKLRLLPALLFRKKSDVLPLKLDENNGIVPPGRRALDEGAGPESFTEKVNTFYDHFNIHPVMFGHVEKLAQLVARNGGELILVQLPNRAAYQAEVERLYPLQYWRERGALTQLAQRLGVKLHAYRLPEECGLTEASYEDYGHMTPAGAQAFTQRLAELIRADGAAPQVLIQGQ